MNILVPVSLYKLLGGGVLAGTPWLLSSKGGVYTLTSCFLTSLTHRMRQMECCEALGAWLLGLGASVGPAVNAPSVSGRSYIHLRSHK